MVTLNPSDALRVQASNKQNGTKKQRVFATAIKGKAHVFFQRCFFLKK
jgi:hypothetical protein